MKTFTLEPTRDKNLFRVVNREGDWTTYFYAPKKVYLRAVSEILDKGFAKGSAFMQYLAKGNEAEMKEKLELAGERGSRIHRTIEQMLNGEIQSLPRDFQVWNRLENTNSPLTNSEWDALLSFQSFWVKHEPTVLAVEESIYNLKYGYAGTLDAILILTKACEVKMCPCKNLVGKIGIVDWKTSKAIYDSYGAQNAAYGNAPSLKRILGTQKPEYTAILRIGTSHKTTGGYEFVVYDKTETHSNWEKFLAARTIASSEFKPFDPDKEVYEIPDIITLKVVKKQLTKQNDTKIKSYKSDRLENGQKRSGSVGKIRTVLQTKSPDAPVS